MKAWVGLLILLITSEGLANQVCPLEITHSLVLTSETGEIKVLSDPQITARWVDPRTPSCAVFAFRKRELMRREAEIDSLLERLEKRRGRWMERDRREFEQLAARQVDVQRELHNQRLEVTVRYDLAGDEKLPQWVIDRQYRLIIRTPALTWYGLDASEPDGIQIEMDEKVIQIQHNLSLAEACTEAANYEVSLLKN